MSVGGFAEIACLCLRERFVSATIWVESAACPGSPGGGVRCAALSDQVRRNLVWRMLV